MVRDSEGWVFFRNRVGGGIRHNGDFIDPALVEKVVAEHPGVGDAFVWGVPDGMGAPGEKDVVAAVVPVNPGGFDPQDLFAWCRSRLEPNMVPGYVQILAEIPRPPQRSRRNGFFAMFDAHPGAVVTEMRRQTA